MVCGSHQVEENIRMLTKHVTELVSRFTSCPETAGTTQVLPPTSTSNDDLSMIPPATTAL